MMKLAMRAPARRFLQTLSLSMTLTAATAALLFGAGPVLADQQQAADASAEPSADAAPTTTADSDILVRAQRREELKDFVASMTPINPSKQLGRWSERVCPVVAGLPEAQALTMIARIGEVASTLNLRGGGKNCATPLIILVDNEASDVAADLAKRFPITLRRDGIALLGNFVRSQKPVRWISLTDPQGFGGGNLQAVNVKETSNSYIPRSGGYPSRLKGAARPAIAAMIVVVDGKQLANVSLEALSDYVAFVAFANPRQGADWPATSVMSMFNSARGAHGTTALSSDDMSYLRELYATSVDSLGQNQRSSIVSRMVQTDEKSREP